MADTSAAQPTAGALAIAGIDLDYCDQIHAAFQRPEPMCLALVRFDPPPNSGGHRKDDRDANGLRAELESRLRTTLRGYDLMTSVDEFTLLVVLRTLAGTLDLEKRIASLFADLTAPYAAGGSTFHPTIALGAVVREPAEKPTDVLRRAEEALATAAADGAAAPVLF